MYNLLVYNPSITKSFIHINFSTAWHNQPYSLGSYTYIGVGGQPNDIERVAEPLFQRPNHRTVLHIKQM